MAVPSTQEITRLLVAWNSGDAVALGDALQTLEKLDPRLELRFFAGLSLEEMAEALKVSLSAVRRDWSLAEAWLFRELNRKDPAR